TVSVATAAAVEGNETLYVPGDGPGDAAVQAPTASAHGTTAPIVRPSLIERGVAVI
ncbi:hypothetical protein HWN78_26905, partial [Escherichia coli]|nr:hypothetical protein [Escherichia coli]